MKASVPMRHPALLLTLLCLAGAAHAADDEALWKAVFQLDEPESAKSAAALRLANQATQLSLAKHFRAHIQEVERLYLDRLMSTADAVEGIQAFLEKRPATFKDC